MCRQLMSLAELNPKDLTPGKHVAVSVQLPLPQPLMPRSHLSSSNTEALCEVEALNTLPCLLWVPYAWDQENYRSRPLVVFLHGSSARGDISAAENIALTKSLTGGSLDGMILTEEALVLSPICPRGVEWRDVEICRAVNQTIDIVITKLAIDSDRVILTGISMGGLGTWMLGARFPDRFAALLPVCGGGSAVYAKLIKHIPMWFAHSEEDNVVAVEDSDRLVRTLHELGAEDVRYTRFKKSPDPAAQGK